MMEKSNINRDCDGITFPVRVYGDVFLLSGYGKWSFGVEINPIGV